MTTSYNAVHVLVTAVSLPACCRRPQRYSSPAHCSTAPPSSYLLLAQVLRVNSLAGLSYVAWKCTTASASAAASSAPPQQDKLHSQWIPQRRVSSVHPTAPDANAALGRGPHDSKFEVDNPRVALWSATSGAMGRFTVAKQRIRAGERAFQAAAFAVVVRQSLSPRRCHWCFASLRKKALQCGDCEFARYCTRDCLAADAVLHDFQCQALRKLKHVPVGSYGGGRDVETVRLALAVLSMEKFVRNPQALTLLAVHRRHESSEEEETRAAVAFIVEMTGQVLDPKHVQTTLDRVRCNAHPLYLDGVTCVGTGVFPEAAMALNHSCLPNVVPSFDPRARALAFHAIAEIPRGGAVEYAYIDLLQTRKRRRTLLEQGFGFDCMCERCTSETALLKREVDPAEAGEDEQETRVMEQLMQLVNSKQSDVKQRLAHLKKEYEAVFERGSEARFALYSAEMQLARAQGDWGHVVKAAGILLEIWSRCGLPDSYYITETLHLQICLAAKQAGMAERANASAKQVAHIRQICGYSHPEAPIG
ncbi:Zinc finger MYND domain-containing protein 15 [Phytophthora pseudosyringae]|uniref:Zinc finger MYND domain-containing protein 15 n=1 Tax=Phytophthora pseudosyringae TaxID=221518 RepID=A0A8T1WC72_9STRA|nr:Zinc finger MYND domain-containing protein 15 [Phytophthora pseudosyringae]